MSYIELFATKTIEIHAHKAVVASLHDRDYLAYSFNLPFFNNDFDGSFLLLPCFSIYKTNHSWDGSTSLRFSHYKLFVCMELVSIEEEELKSIYDKLKGNQFITRLSETFFIFQNNNFFLVEDYFFSKTEEQKIFEEIKRLFVVNYRCVARHYKLKT